MLNDREHKSSSAQLSTKETAGSNAGYLVDNRGVSNPVQRKGSLPDNRSGSVVQLQSWVKYNTAGFDLGNNTKEIVGQEMKAHIEQAHPMHGSAPGSGVQAVLMGTLKHAGYMRMIRGHLLNGQFGGLGIAANLFPITSSANSKHKNHVENPIKQKIKEGKDIDYSVTVVSKNTIDDPNAQFLCDATTTDGSWKRQEIIESTPSKVKKSDSGAEGKALLGTDTAAFRSKDMPGGFGERGRGYMDNVAHHNTFDKYELKYEGKELDDASPYVGGLNLIEGDIDRAGYAHELLEKYVEDHDLWPVKINGKNLDEDGVVDMIDEGDEDEIEMVISVLESLL